MSQQTATTQPAWRVRPEWPFLLFLLTFLSAYLGLLLLLVGGNLSVVSWEEAGRVLGDRHIRAALGLSLVSSTATAILSLLVAVPVGYLLSRYSFRERSLVDTLVDIPILMPPLTIGLSLLILFNQVTLVVCFYFLGGAFALALVMAWRQQAGRPVTFFFGLGALLLTGAGWWTVDAEMTPERFFGAVGLPVTFHPLGVVLAQFPVAAAFAIRMMETSFNQISPRYEEVAMSLGCHRGQAFRVVVLPLAGRAILASGTMAWARALGEFGPILVFAGAIRGKTEVLSTSVYLELNAGNLAGAAVLSLLMIALAVGTLLLVRLLLGKGGGA
jgi:molybdate transport system permease protein